MSYPTVQTPPAGWQAHPQAPGYYYNPQQPSEMVLVNPSAAPPPPAAPVETWQDHPQAPGWEWNPQTNATRQKGAPAAPPTVAAQADTGLPAPSYGSIDPDLAKREAEKAARGKRSYDDDIYLDFPELPREVGSEVRMNVRLLPPWSPDEKSAWVIGARHRLYAEMDPKYQDNWKSKLFFPECYGAHDAKGGDCEICDAVSECMTSDNEEANAFGDDAKASERHYWQALHLDDLQKHIKQYTRDGQPVVNPATGEVLWIVQPGILAIRPTLGRKLLNLVGIAPRLADPDRGVNITLIKKRTSRGSFPMNVEYDAIGDMGGPSALDPQLRSVLGNLINLQESCVRLRPREDMAKIAQNIRDRFKLGRAAFSGGTPPALPPTDSWIRHPNNPAYEYNPTTQAVRQASAPALPPVPPTVPSVPAVVAPPPVAPPGPVAAPAGFYGPAGSPPLMPAPPPPSAVAPPPPVKMPPVPGYAPPAGGALPPPSAPGLASGAVVPPPFQPPGVGMAPQPGLPALPSLPSLPPMIGGPVGGVAPPPPPVGALGAAMTPAQIEAAIKASPTGTPF